MPAFIPRSGNCGGVIALRTAHPIDPESTAALGAKNARIQVAPGIGKNEHGTSPGVRFGPAAQTDDCLFMGKGLRRWRGNPSDNQDGDNETKPSACFQFAAQLGCLYSCDAAGN